VNRPTLFNVLHRRDIPDTLPSALVRIHERDEIKIRLENKITQSVKSIEEHAKAEHRQYAREVTSKKQRKTLLFVDDQLIVTESETLLQKFVRILESVISKYGLTVSTSVTKTIAFGGRDSITSKILINNRTIEEINNMIT
jgi:hypothetical protein